MHRLLGGLPEAFEREDSDRTRSDTFVSVSDTPICNLLPYHITPQDERALDALFMLRDRRYGALGIVDHRGVLVGELNMADVCVESSRG